MVASGGVKVGQVCRSDFNEVEKQDFLADAPSIPPHSALPAINSYLQYSFDP